MNRFKIRFLGYAVALGLCLSTGCNEVEILGENTADACADGVDNDSDGKIDCGDAECKVAFFDTLCQDSGTGGNGNGGNAGSGGIGGGPACENELCPGNCEIDDCSPGSGGGAGGDIGGLPCETGVPDPFLPYPAGQHMGVTQGPGCSGHTGKLNEAYDFNVIGGTYESNANMMAVAATAGTVVKVVQWVTGGCSTCTGSNYNGGWGNCVVVQIDNSCLYERYCHLRPNSALVKEGDHVCTGQPLGAIGSTGRSSGDHLHYQRESASGWSRKIDKFQEASIPSGCTPCATSSHLSGCYESTNSASPGCVAPPSPCQGLSNGKYCGSNPQLTGYAGSPNDLVLCQGGQIASTEYCSLGCQIKPPGQNDVCNQSAACGASGQACCNGTTCNAPLKCNGGTCVSCTPDCNNKCGGAADGCGGTCNGTCANGTTCDMQSCVPCGANAQKCCNGTSCNAPLQCNGTYCGCTPNCNNKCGGAADGCGGFCNGSCPNGTTCSNQSCVSCGASGQACCNGTTCNAPLQCNGGTCISCTPNCNNKCGGAADGCGGFCNGSCPNGTMCSNQSCVSCGASGQACCNGTTCNAPLQCNGGTCISCTPSCNNKCGGAADGCGGFCNGSCPNGTTCSNQSCVSCGASGQACCNGITCNSPLQCNGGTCFTCSSSPFPSLGNFTPSFVGNTNCTCATNNPTCHAIYQGKVVSISADKWHANLAFRKFDGGTISAGIKYWVVVGNPSPSCVDLNAYVVRTSGTVAANTTELTIPNVAIWPDQATFDNDAAGTTKSIFIITDGQGSPNLKTWFEKDALVFTKSCP